MSTNGDFIDQLEDYLEEFDGQTPVPGRVRDALHAELTATRQVRPRAGRWKGMTMSPTSPTLARWGVAAGLVVAVGLGAALMLPRDTGVGGAASPSPVSTPTPAPSARASTAGPFLQFAPQVPCSDLAGAGTCIKPGTYVLGAVVPGGQIDVPAGWWEWDYGPGSVGLLVEHADVSGGSGWGAIITQVGDVAVDPCDDAAGTYPREAVDTPDELAAAMADWPDFHATAPERIAIDGVDGVLTRLTSSATCPGATIWKTPQGMPIDGYPIVDGAGSAYAADFRIIRVDGRLLVIRSMASAGTSPFEASQGIAADRTRHEADLVTQQAIIDSIRFVEPAP
jgi:hypothetical protein